MLVPEPGVMETIVISTDGAMVVGSSVAGVVVVSSSTGGIKNSIHVIVMQEHINKQ